MATRPSFAPSLSTDSSNLLDDYVLERVRFQARRLAARFGLPDDRREDFEQDLIVELLKAAGRFDPAGGAAWHTYACRVLDLAIKKLSQLECRRRRREAGRPLRFTESPDGCPSAVNNPAHEAQDDIIALETKLDIEQVLAAMPPRLRAVCELLKTHTPAEAAAVVGIHRSSIYRTIAQVRARFEKAGLGFSRNGAADPRSARM